MSRQTCSRCPAFVWEPESLATGLCAGCRAPGPEMVVGPPPSAPVPTSGNGSCDAFVRETFVRVGSKVRVRAQAFKHCDGHLLTPEQAEYLIAHLSGLVAEARAQRGRTLPALYPEDAQPAGLHETDSCPL